MGNACCAASDVQKNQRDIVDQASPTTSGGAGAEEVAGRARDARDAASREWYITVNKINGALLGVDVDLSDGMTLVVDSVNDGLVKEWNKANPGEEVKVGDRITEVNGKSGDAQQLAEACGGNAELRMRVSRPAAAPPAP
mmetsp:Transcript_83136/g.240608  ORF Transcript_83136/g.240608 Transcript_83136/m.240608 type:complete len:140 (-) Transcript_83136:149-568(-)